MIEREETIPAKMNKMVNHNYYVFWPNIVLNRNEISFFAKNLILYQVLPVTLPPGAHRNRRASAGDLPMRSSGAHDTQRRGSLGANPGPVMALDAPARRRSIGDLSGMMKEKGLDARPPVIRRNSLGDFAASVGSALGNAATRRGSLGQVITTIRRTSLSAIDRDVYGTNVTIGDLNFEAFVYDLPPLSSVRKEMSSKEGFHPKPDSDMAILKVSCVKQIHETNELKKKIFKKFFDYQRRFIIYFKI